MNTIFKLVGEDKDVQAAITTARGNVIEQVEGSDRFIQRFKSLTATVDRVLRQAEEAEDPRATLEAVREARGLLDLESKVTITLLGIRDGQLLLEEQPEYRKQVEKRISR